MRRSIFHRQTKVAINEGEKREYEDSNEIKGWRDEVVEVSHEIHLFQQVKRRYYHETLNTD